MESLYAIIVTICFIMAIFMLVRIKIRAHTQIAYQSPFPSPGLSRDTTRPSNKDIKQESEDSIKHKRDMLTEYTRRLRPLEIQEAQRGRSTPPEILTEIADLNRKIITCKAEISSLESTIETNTLKYNQQSAVTLNLEYWNNIASGMRTFIDRLLLEEPLDSEDVLFQSLQIFLENALNQKVSVEIFSDQFKTIEPIQDVNDFWIMLTVSNVIDKDSHIKWLVKETIKYLQSEKVNHRSRIHKTWQYIVQKYCIHTSIYFNEHILDRIIDCAIQRIQKSHTHLYVFFDYLYSVVGSDRMTVRCIAERLEQYADQLGSNATPAFLERIKRLIGTGKKIGLHGTQGIPQFTPKLVSISTSIRCNYEFQAMLYPITNYDFYSICGRWPKNDFNAEDPYVFIVNSDNEQSPFNHLESDLLSLIELCRKFEDDDNFQWDVPTANEWLALAGCERTPYPWGNDQPTPERANLRFGNNIPRLHPVGSHPLGVSTEGTYDCCGNVYEIVRISDRRAVPYDFRLAGGCYRTPFRDASCQVFGQFARNEVLMRKNVGLRLVRYRREDEIKRFQSLKHFLRQQNK